MQFLLLLVQVLPLIPGIVRAVESIHGAGNGATKLQSAMGLVAAVVPAVATHIAADATNGSTLARVISAVVAMLNAAGSWADSANAQAAPAEKQVGS